MIRYASNQLKLNTETKDLCPKMSPLHLLENAMNMLVEKQHEINRLKNTAPE